jgi:hypothetical protein
MAVEEHVIRLSAGARVHSNNSVRVGGHCVTGTGSARRW